MILAHQTHDFNNFVQVGSLFIYTFYISELGLVVSGKRLSSAFQSNNPLENVIRTFLVLNVYTSVLIRLIKLICFSTSDSYVYLGFALL